MKYYILKRLAQHLKNFSVIKHIKRVDNNCIKIEFENKNIYYFDLTKGNSMVYKKHHNENIKKDFNAPFDILLAKRFISSKIVDVYLLNDDKILNIKIRSKNRYKEEEYILQMEFTGKNTNIIILDSNNIIQEALRHIDEYSSVRVVQVGQQLQPLQKPDFKYKLQDIEDIDQYLYDLYNKYQQQQLAILKKQKLSAIKKDISKLQERLSNLEDQEQLKQKLQLVTNEANMILSNIYKYTGYQKQQKIIQSNKLFAQAKKYKQKIKNQHIELTNLTQKINFYQRLYQIIQDSNSKDEIEFYMPPKQKNKTKTKKSQPYQSFFIDGYKLMLGKDERENIYLLQNSKASDFWFHLKNQASSHLIVKNRKKTLPQHIIQEAAKICAKFSVQSSGSYEVDYTQRRNVKIQTKANVLYNPYSTIVVDV
jgi:predicted ribosome quality control (RQC) complex YloA/Tae2 family protein